MNLFAERRRRTNSRFQTRARARSSSLDFSERERRARLNSHTQNASLIGIFSASANSLATRDVHRNNFLAFVFENELTNSVKIIVERLFNYHPFLHLASHSYQ